MSENELDIYCKIVEMRSIGRANKVIAFKLGITNEQVCSKIGKLKYNFTHRNGGNNILKEVCDRLEMTAREVIDAVSTKIVFTFLNSNRPFEVMINHQISSNKIWYHSLRGQRIRVIKQDGQYYTDTPAKLRIRHQDCVEV